MFPLSFYTPAYTLVHLSCDYIHIQHVCLLTDTHGCKDRQQLALRTQSPLRLPPRPSSSLLCELLMTERRTLFLFPSIQEKDFYLHILLVYMYTEIAYKSLLAKILPKKRKTNVRGSCESCICLKLM